MTSVPPASASRSLKYVLAVWLLVPLVALVPIAASLQYWLTLQPALRVLDQALGDEAIALANLLRVEPDGKVVYDISEQTERSLRTDRLDTILFAVIAPDRRMLAGDAVLARARIGDGADWNYADAIIDEVSMRVTAHRVECGAGWCEVRVAETLRKREQARRDVLLGTMTTLLVMATLLVPLTYIGIARGLRPLMHLRDELAHRSLDNLSPLERRHAPAELQPLVDSVNRLFERVRDAAARQQAFIADAAHQLRTPLTALRTEAELALLEPHPPALAPTLQRLNAASARAARLANQLLAVARAETELRKPDGMELVDLKTIAMAVAREWVPRALAAGVDLGFALDSARVICRPVLLEELLANLLHNAIEYAGRSAHVTVRTGVRDGAAFLEIEDNGPGIATADRLRVFERFNRGSAPRGAGSGLGLSIVRDIALRHAGSVELLDGTDGKGLLVRVRLPMAGSSG
ncbi:MAG TPA: sensor histidine kinase N-terminal domain-containing protein [Burkholderiaceae bacterium]|nr:sensor histidine kinase N-terminal domain-containing protein [Burkholderiaceae bacterium]